MSSFRRNALTSVMLLAGAGLCGCESMMEGIPRWGKTASAEAGSERTIDSERTKYQADRSPRSQRWLLAHGVQSQMTVAEINTVFGEDGARVYDDAWLKKGNGYRTDDVVYSWGPDRNGRNVYLVFRNGRLVNFDPKEFE